MRTAAWIQDNEKGAQPSGGRPFNRRYCGLKSGCGSGEFLQFTLHLNGARAQLFILGLQQPIIEATIVFDRTQAVCRNAEFEAAIELLRDQSNVLKVRQEDTLGLIVSVADIVADQAALAGKFANARHDEALSFESGIRIQRELGKAGAYRGQYGSSSNLSLWTGLNLPENGGNTAIAVRPSRV